MLKNESNGKAKDENVLAFVEEDQIKVMVLKASGTKCARCWKFTTDVGINKEHPEICAQCVEAISDGSLNSVS